MFRVARLEVRERRRLEYPALDVPDQRAVAEAVRSGRIGEEALGCDPAPAQTRVVVAEADAHRMELAARERRLEWRPAHGSSTAVTAAAFPAILRRSPRGRDEVVDDGVSGRDGLDLELRQAAGAVVLAQLVPARVAVHQRRVRSTEVGDVGTRPHARLELPVLPVVAELVTTVALDDPAAVGGMHDREMKPEREQECGRPTERATAAGGRYVSNAPSPC